MDTIWQNYLIADMFWQNSLHVGHKNYVTSSIYFPSHLIYSSFKTSMVVVICKLGSILPYLEPLFQGFAIPCR
jgi:hypothetical protein